MTALRLLPRRHHVVLALAAGASLVPAARAQEPDRGTFGIAPAKVLITARPPVDVQPLQLTNTTRRTYDVRVFVAPLRQAADGGLAIDASAAARRLGARTLRVDATRFTLAPNDRRDLRLRWLRTLPSTRVAPMGIVVQGLPRGVEQGAVRSVYRLVGTYLMRLPGGRRDGRFVSLTAEQGTGRTLAFSAVVRNTGDVYDSPRRGHVTVTDSGGRPVVQGAFKGETVLPGAQRPFTVTTRKVLPAGDYVATANMLFGASSTPKRITRRFRLIGPNQLPTTRLAIADLQASGYVGEAARATVRVRNTGTVGVKVAVRARLIEAPGGRPARSPADQESAVRTLAPGREATLEFELGRLSDVDYRVDASALVSGRSLDTSRIAISPRPKRSVASRVGRFLSDHAVLLVLLLALVAVAATAEYTRRYRARLRAQLEAARVEPTAPERDPRPPVSG